MITDENLERLREKVERQRRELEEMQRAIAAYRGPVTKCPPFKTTDPLARPKADRGGHDGMVTAGASSAPAHRSVRLDELPWIWPVAAGVFAAFR